MKETLAIPADQDGWLRLIQPLGRLRMHRHAELEANLVLRGRGSYLPDDRKYGSVAEFVGEMGDAVPQTPWDLSL